MPAQENMVETENNGIIKIEALRRTYAGVKRVVEIQTG
jgi:hypothetical protein